VAANRVFPIFLHSYPLSLSVKCATAAGKVKQIIKFLIISNGRQGRKFIFLIVSKTFPNFSPSANSVMCVCVCVGRREMEVNEISTHTYTTRKC